MPSATPRACGQHSGRVWLPHAGSAAVKAAKAHGLQCAGQVAATAAGQNSWNYSWGRVLELQLGRDLEPQLGRVQLPCIRGMLRL